MRRIVVFVISIAVLAASPAMARSKQSDVARAKQLFNKAEQHFAKEEYRDALESYQQAFEAKPLPGFHFNIAQCHRALGNYEKAIEHFEQYLAQSGNPANKAEAERLLQASRDELADQQRRQAPEEEPPLDPAPATIRPPAPAPAPAPAGGRKRLRPIYFWSGVGLTAALLLTGTITGAMALSKSSTFKDSTTPYEDLQGLKDAGESLRTTSSVTVALGLVAAAGTATLYFFTDFGPKETAAAATPVPGGALVTMGGRF